jgi:gas vesicle protein
MTFLLGMALGSLVTIGAAFIIAPDDDVDNSY